MLALTTYYLNELFRGSGIKLLDKIATYMSDQYCNITQASAIRLHNALAKEFGNMYANSSKSSISFNVAKWNPAEKVPVRDTPAKSNELLTCRAGIDLLTGSCNVTNIRLWYYPLTHIQRSQMSRALMELGEKVNAREEMKKFSNWLEYVVYRRMKSPAILCYSSCMQYCALT